MDLHAKLASLNLKLPVAPKPIGHYVPAVRTGNLVYVSGQLPMSEGQLIAKGPVPSAVSLEQGQAAARQCALNALAIVGEQIGGDWSRLVRIVRVAVFVASDNGFTDQPKVANGASELLGQLFGDAGKHARAAVGVNVLPLGATVEVELIAEVR
jgi:enamine deaminase RidA (YjgF/YER057c/UK114 family)